ncbi:MAG: ArsA family ATPase [Thiohalocapsa sp.]|nr:ArsA family ATPase [Thiohalocapsa sp.]MCF7990503.1 ArsA family ATPase [Thiohalocapsa sp.]
MSALEPGSNCLEETALSLLFFGGKGGVGKTSCACASALCIARARPGESVLLLSTDPAHSVRDALADLRAPRNLVVLELDAEESLERFRAQYRGQLREIPRRGTLLDNDDIDALLEVALPGMDELAAYLEMAAWVEQRRYGCIVVDTAPTGHTLRLLTMPSLVRRWLSALDALLATHRYMRRRFGCDPGDDHLDRFLLELEHTRRTLVELLGDARRCRFVPVTLAERMSLTETDDLLEMLAHDAVTVTDIIINRVRPQSRCGGPQEGSKADPCPVCTAERARQLAVLAPFSRQHPDQRLLALPMLPDEPRGGLLEGLWPRFETLGHALHETIDEGALAALPTRVEHASALPPAGLRLLIFAGKGGVGKTTLACASALHLSRRRPGDRLLLFSTDPAHSLSDALGRDVGPRAVSIAAGLDAQEVDAETAFGAIRAVYLEEIGGLFGDQPSQLDIAFDREVMQRLLDLAPPGLDEIMALTAVMEHLDGGCYDLIVLDAAPSGHLLRLLALPPLINNWLKLFFELLLKYRNVMRMPRLSARLVALSRAVKRLRALLSDPHRTRVHLVTVATELGIAETADLTSALSDMHVSMPVLAINQLTPPGPEACACPLCSALRVREARHIDDAARRFSRMHRVQVYRQREPIGLDGLAELGAALYRQSPAGVSR